jgi:mevalonate kinase
MTTDGPAHVAAAATVPARAVASAPGKLILAGEHAVVHGRPALIAALDLRLTATFAAAEGAEGAGGAGAVRIAVPPLGLDLRVPWSEIAAYARAARERWQVYAATPTAAAFAAVRGADPAHLVKIALGEAREALGDGSASLSEAAGPPLSLQVDGDLPVGAGFGSSAAAAVALVAGYLALRGVHPPPAAIERLALEVERRQHGLPSGVDGATVLHGGLRWAERDAEGRLVTRPLAARSPLLSRLRVFHTGLAAESTGAVVAAVRERLATAPRRVEAALDAIAAATLALRDQLAADAEDPAAVREILAACHRALVELGVVPAGVRELVARIEGEGGAAKISGAGSLAGPGAGSLLVYHPQPERVEGWAFLAPLRRYPTRLGAPGLRLQAAAGEGGAT